VVNRVRPPDTNIRFSFEGMLDGVCGDETHPEEPECEKPCEGPLEPINTRQRMESILL
jgi:hypothetical protein